jgi:hypothetical protein
LRHEELEFFAAQVLANAAVQVHLLGDRLVLMKTQETKETFEPMFKIGLSSKHIPRCKTCTRWMKFPSRSTE